MDEFDLRFLDKLARTRKALNFIFAHMQAGKLVIPEKDTEDNRIVAEMYEDAYKVLEELYVMFDRQDGADIPLTSDEKAEIKRKLREAQDLKCNCK